MNHTVLFFVVTQLRSATLFVFTSADLSYEKHSSLSQLWSADVKKVSLTSALVS